jgi:hypothetical protein
MVDISVIQELINRGALVRLEMAPRTDDGQAMLVGKYRKWLADLDLNARNGVLTAYPVLKFLKEDIEQRLQNAIQPCESDEEE